MAVEIAIKISPLEMILILLKKSLKLLKCSVIDLTASAKKRFREYRSKTVRSVNVRCLIKKVNETKTKQKTKKVKQETLNSFYVAGSYSLTFCLRQAMKNLDSRRSR